MPANYQQIVNFIRQTFAQSEGFIPLHAPRFDGNEKKYVLDTIDSTFVSSVGEYVGRFEEMVAEITGAKHAVAIVNGTCAIHLALQIVGVGRDEEVLTQPLTFVATANAVAHAGATPHFVDVDLDTMGMSPQKLAERLAEIAEVRGGECFNKQTGKRIAACLPMHTFGFPLRIDEVIEICDKYKITVVEDSAESLGSFYKGKHTGKFGILGTFSFNGNKTVTCGGGGAIITDDAELAKRAKHLSTTAKLAHSWEYAHDAVAYNYRLTNLSAALGCAQLEQLGKFIENKRETANLYRDFFAETDVKYVNGIENAEPNFWLSTILLENKRERDEFLEYSNRNDVMCRPAWTLMNDLPMFAKCPAGDLENAQKLEERIVNIPSSVR